MPSANPMYTPSHLAVSRFDERWMLVQKEGESCTLIADAKKHIHTMKADAATKERKAEETKKRERGGLRRWLDTLLLFAKEEEDTGFDKKTSASLMVQCLRRTGAQRMINVITFIFRARWGTLTEKAKAYERVHSREGVRWRWVYGDKYQHDDRCPHPGCNEKEHNLHCLRGTCVGETKEYEHGLSRVRNLYASRLHPQHRERAKHIPAWFFTRDAAHLQHGQPRDSPDEDLQKLEGFDKMSGSLGVMPRALVKWTRKQQWANSKTTADGVLLEVFELLVTRAHNEWIHRQKVFGAFWSQKQKENKAQHKREREADKARRAREKKEMKKARERVRRDRRGSEQRRREKEAEREQNKQKKIDEKKERQAAREAQRELRAREKEQQKRRQDAEAEERRQRTRSAPSMRPPPVPAVDHDEVEELFEHGYRMAMPVSSTPSRPVVGQSQWRRTKERRKKHGENERLPR